MAAKSFDIVVVGAGAAGCVVAARLAEGGDRSVLLLEAGPALPQPVPAEWRDAQRLPSVPDWGFSAEPGGSGAGGRLRRGRLVGGTGWLTRFAVRGAAADFDAWAARGNPGWTYADLLPAFVRAETDAEFGANPVHGDRGPIPVTRYPQHPPSEIHAAALQAFHAMGFPAVDDHNLPRAVGVGPMPMSSRDGQRVTTADAYLAPVQSRSDLVVRADAPVARVFLEGSRATGVVLADGSVVRAEEVVLSAGTYGSPAILMRSGVGPASHLRSVGVAPRIDLAGVGANLADHPAVDLDSGWRGEAKAGPILHSIATKRSLVAPPGGAPDLMFWVSDPDGEEPGFYFDPILLKPVSRGSVRLRSADPADAPRIRLPGLREAADVARLAEAYTIGLELADQPEVRRLARDAAPSLPATPAALRKRVMENAYSIPHVVGTCRMGPSPDEGDVVDARGFVHGVDRLRVIDASVIPEPPSGFPFLVSIVLAEHLAARWHGPS